MREFERVVPESGFTGAKSLRFFPGVDDNDILDTGDVGIVIESGAMGEFLVRGGGVGDNHDMIGLFMFEEVLDTFLFHQAAGEIKIGFPVLGAVVAWLIRALELEGDGEADEDQFKDIGDAFLLKNAALGGPCQ